MSSDDTSISGSLSTSFANNTVAAAPNAPTDESKNRIELITSGLTPEFIQVIISSKIVAIRIEILFVFYLIVEIKYLLPFSFSKLPRLLKKRASLAKSEQ